MIKVKSWEKIHEEKKMTGPPSTTTQSPQSESINIEIDDESFIALALEAHRLDIKLNDYIVMKLQEIIDEEGLDLVAEKVVGDG